MKIYPSLISSDILALRHVIQTLNNECAGYHLDVMDDHFVPNLTWGPAFINAIAGETALPLQIHLMVDNPLLWVDRLELQEKDSLIFHYEALKGLSLIQELIYKIKNKKVRVGVAINPATSVEVLDTLFKDLDEVLVMSVNPGFSGQSFIDVTDKVITLSRIKKEKKFSYLIAMDGGISRENISIVKRAGVDIIGVASAIFFQPNYIQALRQLKEYIQKV